MSFSSNVKYYVMGFLEDGTPSIRQFANTKPIEKNDTEYITNIKNEIYKTAEASEPSVKLATVEIINASDYNLYLQNYVRDMGTGKPVPYVAPEPTVEEKAANEINTISSDTNAEATAIQKAMVAAILNDDVELQEELKQEYKELMSSSNQQMQEVVK